MARTSKQAKAASRTAIVEEAARLFRDRGIEGTGISELMSAAGLTHGGFYRHFGSKDELVGAAIDKAFTDIASVLEREIAELGGDRAVARYVERYLSEEHVLRRDLGCPMAALGADAGRGAPACRDALAAGAARIIELLQRGMVGGQGETHTRATALMATLVGTITLARAASSPDAVKRILAAGHHAAKMLLAGDR